MPDVRDTTIIKTLFLHSVVTRQVVNGSEEGNFVGQLREAMTSSLKMNYLNMQILNDVNFILGIKSQRIIIEEHFSVFSQRQQDIKKMRHAMFTFEMNRLALTS